MVYSGKTSGAAGIAATLALVLIGDSGAVGQAVMRSAMAYDSYDGVGSWESKGSYSAIELATIITDARSYRHAAVLSGLSRQDLYYSCFLGTPLSRALSLFVE